MNHEKVSAVGPVERSNVSGSGQLSAAGASKKTGGQASVFRFELCASLDRDGAALLNLEPLLLDTTFARR